MRRRVAITGMGAVTPVGNDAGSTWAALLAGRSGVGPITTFAPAGFPVRIAGLVKDFDLEHIVPSARLTRHLHRAAGFGIAATAEALASSGLRPADCGPEEIGVAMGGSPDRPALGELAEMTLWEADPVGRPIPRAAPSTVLRRSPTVHLAAIGLLAGAQGPLLGLSTACSSSAHAIGEAYRLVQEGSARVMVAGGYDALTSYLDVLGFALLGALTTAHEDEPWRASRPFDADRSGFVIGEGGVAFVLEDWELAESRGARILAEVAGYGTSMNAWRMTDSPPDGAGATTAIANALADSGVEPRSIGYVAAHGTSTPGNDLSETNALKSVFGDHAYRLVVSSPKSMTGHLTAAAGGLNVLAAVGAIRDGAVPPTINLDNPDPRLDLDYVPNRAREVEVRAALVDAFAFGGTNVCLVLTRPA
jgi:3-oxoacyl-[acyl-carrier-protein] synthase II